MLVFTQEFLVMLYQFMIQFAFILQAAYSSTIDQKKCICQKIQTEFECMRFYQNVLDSGDVDTLAPCIWYQNKCQNLRDYIQDISCSSLNMEQCTYTGANSYMINPICFYYQKTQSCTKFTRCDIYKFDTEEDATTQCKKMGCKSSSKQCAYDLLARQEQYCSQIYQQSECTSTFIPDKKHLCLWEKNKCLGVEVTKCSMLLTEAQCNTVAIHCAWRSYRCTERTCQDLQKKDPEREARDYCVSFYSLEQEKYIYCSQEGTDCIGKNPTELSKLKCNRDSRNTHFWNTTSSSCYPCLFESHSRLIFLVYIGLTVFM